MPEEINRRDGSRRDILLAPTPMAMENARREGLSDKCSLVGDIMVDSLLFGIGKARSQSHVLQELKINKDEKFHLLTLHRPYNVDSPQNLEHILSSLDTLGTRVVFPVHPRTRQVLQNMQTQAIFPHKLVVTQAYLIFLCSWITAP